MLPQEIWCIVASYANLRTCQAIRCLAKYCHVPLVYPEPRRHTFTLYRRSRAAVCEVEWTGRAWRVQTLYPWCGLICEAHLPVVFWDSTRHLEYFFDSGTRLRVSPSAGCDVRLHFDWSSYVLSPLNDVTSLLV
jgi:hypothetical protein